MSQLNLGSLSSQGMLNQMVQQCFPPPTKANSWLYYECWLEFEADPGVVIGQTLPTEPLVPSGKANHWNVLTSTSGPPDSVPASLFAPLAELIDSANDQIDDTGGAQTFVQQRNSPIIVVNLVGKALRAGFPIPIPELISFGDATLQLVTRLDHGEGFKTGIIGNTDVPIYGAGWRLRYVVTGELPTNAIPVPPNPTMS
jgi:hypothetical protein